MSKRPIHLFAALLSGLLAGAHCTAIADGHNPIKDASFEQRLAPAEGGWRLFDESFVSNDVSRSGEHSMFNGGLSRTVGYPPYFEGTVSGSYQAFPAEPGSSWRLTGYGFVSTALAGSAFGIVQVSFFDAEGKDLGTLETVDSTTKAKTSNKVSAKSPIREWVLLDTGIATAPEGTTAIHAFTIYVDYSGSNVSQGVYFDDLTLCAVGDESTCAD